MVLEQRLFVRIFRILAEHPHSSKLEPRNPIKPRRILAELPGSSYEEGSRQDGKPSEPHHSPNKAMPSCYTKNGSFATGISEMWGVF
jgi:hypothetical protein